MRRRDAHGPPQIEVTRFPVPPAKIACGFYHSVVISNSSSREAPPTDKEKEKQDAGALTLEVLAAGSNRHNTLGIEQEQLTNSKKGAKLDEMETDIPKFQRVKYNNAVKYGDPYQVACGTRHTVFIFKKPDQTGGVLFASGLGNRGRLGMRSAEAEDDNEEVDHAWSTDGLLGPLPKSPGGPPLSVLRVDCGADHSLCFATDGRLYAFGANKEGQCGVNFFPSLEGVEDVRHPRQVAIPVEKKINHFACGAKHSLAAVADGELWTWGAGSLGRLGLGHMNSTGAPTFVGLPGDAHCLFVAGGEAHSGMIDQEGKVWTWGAGSYGRLGTGSLDDAQVPVVVEAFDAMSETPGQIKIMAIALGGFHTLFLEEPNSLSGRIFSCGSGSGAGFYKDEDQKYIPVPSQLSDTVFALYGGIKQICAGMYHNLVLQENGELVSWGVGANGRLGDGKVKNAIRPEVHKLHGFALKPIDAPPDEIQSFTHATERRPQNDKQALAAQEAARRKNASDVKQVECGSMHTVALLEGGQVYVWGSNSNGQLGLGMGSPPTVWIPKKLALGTRHVKEVAVGFEHCLAVTTTAELWSWGKGTSGQLGTGHTRDEMDPRVVPGLSQVLTCAAGEEHSCAIVAAPTKRAGIETTLYSWGSAENGVLGLGEVVTSGPQGTPLPVDTAVFRAGLKAAQAAEVGPLIVRCGSAHTAVIVGTTSPHEDADVKETPNRVFTFGSSWYGRLGLGEAQKGNVYTPHPIRFPNIAESITKDVSCGAYHTYCLTRELNTKEDTLYGWGRDRLVCETEGQHVAAPQRFTKIDGQPAITNVKCGELHTCAVTVKGELWAWGSNKNGQLGLSKPFEWTVPELVKLQGGCSMVGTGPNHTMVISTGSGEMWACGLQSCGRLGLEDKDSSKNIWEPKKVQAEWSSIQEMSTLAVEKKAPQRTLDDIYRPDDGTREDKLPTVHEQAQQMNMMLKALNSGQKVTTFGTMQALIKQEAEASRPENIRAREAELQRDLNSIIKVIKSLGKNEHHLLHLEHDFKQSLDSNLKTISRNLEPPEVGGLKINPQLVAKLTVFEELLWVLQTQVFYLASLGVQVENNEEDREVFFRVVKALYAGAQQHQHTQNLYLMCIRLMFSKEIDRTADSAVRLEIDKVFDHKTSRALQVFTDYALSPLHWIDVIHKYMKVPAKDDPDQDVLLTKLKTASTDRSETFAIGFEDFKEALHETGQLSGTEKKDAQDLQQEYQSHIDGFRAFLIEDFVKQVVKVQLPKDLRLLFKYLKEDVDARQPSLGERTADTPEEFRRCVPLLRLLCHGILIPILRNTHKYVSKRVLLKKSEDATTEPLVASNLTRVANLLEAMLDNSLESQKAEMRVLHMAAATVKAKLLEYCFQQADIMSELEASVMVNTYATHFDRTPRYVAMSISDLMLLSNMLKRYDSSLRANENDHMASLVRKIPKWDEATIEEAKRNDRLYNFTMNSRFLLTTDEEVRVCPVSQIPMPASLCASGAEPGLFRTYEDAGPGDARQALEQLFGKLEPLKASDFSQMKAEFEELRTAQRQGNSPNYEIVQRLQEGLRVVEELENAQASPEDVLQFMSSSLILRDKHNQYLQMIGEWIHKLEQIKKHYEVEIVLHRQELEQALEASRELKIPRQFTDLSLTTTLKFQQLRAQVAKRAFDPNATKKLNLAYTPIQKYPLKWLEKNKVVEEVFPPFSEQAMKKEMQITFKATTSGGVNLEVSIVKKLNQTTVKTLVVSAEMLQDMKNAEAGDKVALANPGEKPFLTVQSTEFVKLAVKLSQQTGG